MVQQSKEIDLHSLPGHYVRRVHQLAVALFAQEIGRFNITPVQYSSLQTICNLPGIDQKTLASTIGFDTSTIGGVIDRLEARGFVVRNVAPTDRRVRLITPTEKGRQLLAAIIPPVLKSQERLLEPLSQKEKHEFMRIMKVLVAANAELSNIPSKE